MISRKINSVAAPKPESLEFHPLSNLFPLMNDAEFDALVKDIREHGQLVPIVLLDGKILEGRNRYNAHMKLGGELLTRNYNKNEDGDSPAEFVMSMNFHRRHLNAQQKRDVIGKMLLATPEKSNRAIAEDAKVDHKTVGDVRDELEAGGEIPHHQSRVGADGVEQPAAKKKKRMVIKPRTTEPVKTEPEETAKSNGQAPAAAPSQEIIAAPNDMPSLETAIDTLIWHATHEPHFINALWPAGLIRFHGAGAVSVYRHEDMELVIQRLKELDKDLGKPRAEKKKAEAAKKNELAAMHKAAAEAAARIAQKDQNYLPR
jgi:hypothetical protein